MEQKRSPLEIFLLCLMLMAYLMLSFASYGIKVIAVGLLFASTAALALHQDARMEASPDPDSKLPRYTPLFSIFSLFLIGLIPVLVYRFLFPQSLGATLLSDLCGLLLTASLYYILLAAALPLFRRYFSARACAALWLLPSLLNFLIVGIPLRQRPLVVLDVPERLLPPILVLWLTVAAVLLVWSILSHLRFRRHLLKDAVRVEDPAVLAVWAQVCKDARRKKQPILCRSPRTGTPLSIGLFARTTRVVLPEKDYAPEDLALVLKHELVHIMRQDSRTKLFLTLVRALCWFNPLMWLAMRKSSDDMELSCDETVLDGADEEQRRRYARLLLHTAGDQRGFTTCLSASASALRYRMRAVTAPSRRYVGGLLAGAMVLLLFVLSGTAAFSARHGTMEELTMPQGAETYRLNAVYDLTHNRYFDEPDTEAVLDYLADLPLRQISGQYVLAPSARSWEPEGSYLEFRIYNDDGLRYFKLSGEGLHICREHYQDSPLDESYLVDAEIDWAYLESLLGPES